jgi:hypothetical protein
MTNGGTTLLPLVVRPRNHGWLTMAEWRPQSEQDRQSIDDRTRAGAEAIAAAVSYGLVHSLDEAIARNRTHGWADEYLTTFRLDSDDEVRESWAVLEQRARER